MGPGPDLPEAAALHVVERWIRARFRGLVRLREDPDRTGDDRVANSLHHQGELPAASAVLRKDGGHAEPRAAAVEKERRTPGDDVTIEDGVQMPTWSPEQRDEDAGQVGRAVRARQRTVDLADQRTVDGKDAQIARCRWRRRRAAHHLRQG